MSKMKDVAPTRRLTREERRAETRERLLDAAGEVFAAHGYHAASVDQVADRAGFSTGAVYSAFGSKEELFLALLDAQLREETEQLEAATRDRPSIDARVRGAADQWMSFVEREPSLVLLYTEFWAYAVRDPRVRPRIAAHYGDVRAALTQLISAAARELGYELTMPVEQLAVAVDALADGIARQKLAEPEAVPDDLLARALSILFAGASRPLHTEVG
jgi:AcrR family transcriptional regulator